MMEAAGESVTHSEDTRRKISNSLKCLYKSERGSKILEDMRRRTKQHEYNGQLKTSKEWAKEFGINFTSFRQRLKNGMTVAQAKDIKPLYRLVDYNGKPTSLKEVAKKEGIIYGTLWSMMKRLNSLEECLKYRDRKLNVIHSLS